VTACSSSNQQASATAPASAGTIKVVASTNVWGSVLSAVGGDKVRPRARRAAFDVLPGPFDQ
jgi:zinc/manganese transport system substrate-binding protein